MNFQLIPRFVVRSNCNLHAIAIQQTIGMMEKESDHCALFSASYPQVDN